MAIDKDKRVAFIGGGNMAEALIRGMLSADAAKSRQILVTDPASVRLEHLREVSYRREAAERRCGRPISCSCVKPRVMDTVLRDIAAVAAHDSDIDRRGIAISRMKTERPRSFAMPAPALNCRRSRSPRNGRQAGDLAMARYSTR
jgi:hypothetical protein